VTNERQRAAKRRCDQYLAEHEPFATMSEAHHSLALAIVHLNLLLRLEQLLRERRQLATDALRDGDRE
jgi:hypothetical protein